MTKQEEKIDELFDNFLQHYLDNVQRILPESMRAQQLKKGGLQAKMVIEFETRFLKAPFEKALEKERIRLNQKERQ